MKKIVILKILPAFNSLFRKEEIRLWAPNLIKWHRNLMPANSTSGIRGKSFDCSTDHSVPRSGSKAVWRNCDMYLLGRGEVATRKRCRS